MDAIDTIQKAALAQLNPLDKPLDLDSLTRAARHAGQCDAVLECARLLRMCGMQDAALVLVQNIEQVARGARS